MEIVMLFLILLGTFLSLSCAGVALFGMSQMAMGKSTSWIGFTTFEIILGLSALLALIVIYYGS